jgi:hypothetical protein
MGIEESDPRLKIRMEDQIAGRVHVYAIFRKERPRERTSYKALCSFFRFTNTDKLFKFGNKLIIHMNVFITQFG